MVNIEIDNVSLEAEEGEMVIQVADRNGIAIPRFCYHEKLSVVANCRMCLVEIEKAPKPMPACATPVRDGMKVFTKSSVAVDAQKGTMEFLLINHPLDCPICDQGGECELQDLSLEYGEGISRFHEKKRVVKDKNIGPLISTDMTRCIHCTRCVRFGEEVAGIKELGATGRSEHMEIGTYVERNIDSELSGNVIDLCPVGALTNKPFRFRARAWELVQHESIAPHDCLGSNLYLHTLRGRVLRAVPRRNEPVNEVWLSDRDRYSLEGLYAGDRLESPMVKRNGDWEAVEWETALEAATAGLRKLVDNHGPAALGTLVSPGATLEEQYLAAKLTRGLGSTNIDHRLRQVDVTDQGSDPVYPALGQSVEALERVETALLIGSNPRKEQPLIGHRLRKAALRGGRIMAINPLDFHFLFPLAEKLVTPPSGMVEALSGVVAALVEGTGNKPAKAVAKLVEKASIGDTHRSMAEQLRSAGDATLLLGPQAIYHPAYSALRALAVEAARLSDSRLGYLPEGANAAGGYLAGAIPHRGAAGNELDERGLAAAEMLVSPRKGYMLVGVEPEHDIQNPASVRTAMQQADFSVALTPYASEGLKACADVLLPIGPFAETAGTFVNVEGRWQSFEGAGRPVGDSRPGWKVLRVLGSELGLGGFDYMDIGQVRDELASRIGTPEADTLRAPNATHVPTNAPQDIERIGDSPLYSVDALVRRAQPLQETNDAKSARRLRLHPRTARDLGLGEGEQARVRQAGGETTMSVELTERVPEGCAWLSAALTETAMLGPSFGSVEIERV